MRILFVPSILIYMCSCTTAPKTTIESKPEYCVFRESKKTTQDCLETAIKDLRAYEPLLRAAKKRYGENWAESNTWFQCSFERVTSAVHLAHGLVHDLGRESCMYDAREDQYLCLNLDRDLPPRTEASIGAFPEYEGIQAAYLTESNPYSTFSELNASIVSTQVATDLIQTGRSRVALPLFMVYTLKYLEIVRAKNFEKFQRNFGRSTGNWAHLHELLNRSEHTYMAWQKALAKRGWYDTSSNLKLWQYYLKMRTRLYLEN